MSQVENQLSIGHDPDAVWLVTGSSSGFGKALSLELKRRGVPLVATARTFSSLSFLGGESDRLCKVELDVTQRISVAKAIAQTLEEYGRIDVVVNNAGIGVIGPVEDVSDEDIRLQFEVNLFGVFNVTRAVQPLFRSQRRGFFINFASMAGEASVPSLGVYSASKFAVEGLSEAVAQEMAPYGIGVMVVEPGPFDTEWIGKNAIWAPRTDRYPDAWEYVTQMKAAYANRSVVGDPAKAATAILAAMAMDPPPFRLALHEYSAEATRGKARAVLADLDRTDTLTRAVHYMM